MGLCKSSSLRGENCAIELNTHSSVTRRLPLPYTTGCLDKSCDFREHYSCTNKHMENVSVYIGESAMLVSGSRSFPPVCIRYDNLCTVKSLPWGCNRKLDLTYIDTENSADSSRIGKFALYGPPHTISTLIQHVNIVRLTYEEDMCHQCP